MLPRRKPFVETVARREQAVYVAHVRIARPGRYQVVARPLGGREQIAGLRDVLVRARSVSQGRRLACVPVTDADDRRGAWTSLRAHDTRASRPGAAAHVDRRRALRTRSVRRDVRDAAVLRQPNLRPVVDVVDRVRRMYARTPIRFIHVEIYTDNNPSKGRNRWVRQWHLPTEPWTFLVGRDGRIKAKFEGAVSARELERAIRQFLL